MQYIFNERRETTTTIEFRNSLPIKNVQKIDFFREFNITGTFLRKEYRYSFNNTTWSPWQTLTQVALKGIPFMDQPDFFLHVRYTRVRVADANIQSFYLFYDGERASILIPDSSVDAFWFRGKDPNFFLNRENHFGPFTAITINNIEDVDSVGVYDSRMDNSLGTTFFFRSLRPGDGVTLTENDGIITIDCEASIGVINVGDGSAGIFSGYDSFGNILLRTFAPGSGIVIEEVGDQILVTVDASFFGDVLGENVGTGDASIFYGKVGPTLQFRELMGGPGVFLSTSDNLVIIDVSTSNVVQSVNGGVWITNIQPWGHGNVGDKIFSSDGNVLDSCLTDTSTLIVSVLALPGNTNYKPFVYYKDSCINLSASVDKPLWTGTFATQFNFADASITVVHEDGARWSTLVNSDIPPVVLNAVFTGGYPGSQTELKSGDTFQVSITTDVPVVQAIIDNYGAFVASTHMVSGTSFIITGTIANRGTTTQDLGFRIRVKKSTGSESVNYLSENHGSVDGVNLVKLNNLFPSISISTINYPVGQGAIKSPESAVVNHTVANFTTVSYNNPLGQLTIANPTTYEPAKTVTYLSGNYNISMHNFSVTATRSQNNATSGPISTNVRIANVAATLTVSNPASRLRSGGNNGTSAQNHTITITANQNLLNAPTLNKDTGGTWQGSGFTGGPTIWTRSLQVHDNNAKGVYNWGAISGTNLAGIVTSTNSGATTYTLGGFVVRTVTIDAFGWQANINVEVVDYTKLSSTGLGQNLAWTIKALPTRSTIGDTTRPQPGVWSASATLTNPTTINILDKSATDSASQASTFTIQEGI